MAKYFVVVGGVFSGIGKGISIASIGYLLSLRGLRVAPIKFDPYLNVDAGILSPHQHGEVFLCNDGSETDLDLGHYERIIGCQLSKKNIYTSGTLYKEIIEEQEDGKYLGETVQFIPHVTNKIIEKLKILGKDSDVVLVEIGGTVGDIESGPFMEAIRQFKQKNPDDVIVALCAPILWVPTIKEFKTKPLQQAVQTMQSCGLQPEVLLCRADREVPNKILDKISALTNVPKDAVFEALDVKSIYQVPIEFYNRHVDDLIIDKFHLPRNGLRIHKYKELVEKYVNCDDLLSVKIGILGKYDNCDEAYLSLKEAIFHAGVFCNVKVDIIWISAQEFEVNKDASKVISELDGLIVPGGFDSRGVEGKINGISIVRNKKIPFLGICLGLQCAVIEFSRFVGLEDANSQEFNPDTKYPVVHFIAGQEKLKKKAATMRLGAYDCDLVKDSLAFDLYKKKTISERHRHRYEVNDELIDDSFTKEGFRITGRHPETNLVEIIEIDRNTHPFFIATQAHPEFKSRLTTPSPLFLGLIEAAKKKKEINKITEKQ
jgi:CTP synthase